MVDSEFVFVGLSRVSLPLCAHKHVIGEGSSSSTLLDLGVIPGLAIVGIKLIV